MNNAMAAKCITEEQWSYLCARVSAVETLVLATATASPNRAQIRAQFAIDTEGRKKALLTTPMTEERIEAAMQPFERLIASLDS